VFTNLVIQQPRDRGIPPREATFFLQAALAYVGAKAVTGIPLCTYAPVAARTDVSIPPVTFRKSGTRAVRAATRGKPLQCVSHAQSTQGSRPARRSPPNSLAAVITSRPAQPVLPLSPFAPPPRMLPRTCPRSPETETPGRVPSDTGAPRSPSTPVCATPRMLHRTCPEARNRNPCPRKLGSNFKMASAPQTPKTWPVPPQPPLPTLGHPQTRATRSA
jgi:hypothetical protein